MATLTRGQTFGVSETITNTKLHNLVDLGTVTSIVDADCSAGMALSNSKLADLMTAGKVYGTSFIFLPSIPSGAGLIPLVNIPYPQVGFSLSSIPNTALVPLTLVSLVDGVSLRNLASTPVTQQVRYNLVVSSLASGGVPTYDGANNFVGGRAGALKITTNLSVTGVTNSGDITIDPTKFYEVHVDIFDSGGADKMAIRINNDTGSNYQYVYSGTNMATTSISGNSVSATSIITTDNSTPNTVQHLYMKFNIYPQGTTSTKWLNIKGEVWGVSDITTGGKFTNFLGSWANFATASSFRLLTVSGNTFTANIILYETVQA